MGVENLRIKERQRESIESLNPSEKKLSPEQSEKITDEKNKSKLKQTEVTLNNFSSRVDKVKNEQDQKVKWNELMMLYVVLERHQKEIQEITWKSNPRTMDIIKLWENLDKKCDEL